MNAYLLLPKLIHFVMPIVRLYRRATDPLGICDFLPVQVKYIFYFLVCNIFSSVIPPLKNYPHKKEFTSSSSLSSFSDIVLLLWRASSQHMRGAVSSLFVKDKAAFRSSLHMATYKHATWILDQINFSLHLFSWLSNLW